MRRWFFALLLSLAAFCLLPSHSVDASTVSMHVGESGEVVQVYDVTVAWNDLTAMNKIARQTWLAENPPASRRLVETAKADDDLTAHFDLTAGRVYLFIASLDEQQIVVPIGHATVDIWPKEVFTTPEPSQPTPPAQRHHHPHLPDTGERRLQLMLLGIALVLLCWVGQRRLRAKRQ